MKETETEDQYLQRLFNKMRSLNDTSSDFITFKELLIEHGNRGFDFWLLLLLGFMLMGVGIGMMLCDMTGHTLN